MWWCFPQASPRRCSKEKWDRMKPCRDKMGLGSSPAILTLSRRFTEDGEYSKVSNIILQKDMKISSALTRSLKRRPNYSSRRSCPLASIPNLPNGKRNLGNKVVWLQGLWSPWLHNNVKLRKAYNNILLIVHIIPENPEIRNEVATVTLHTRNKDALLSRPWILDHEQSIFWAPICPLRLQQGQWRNN